MSGKELAYTPCHAHTRSGRQCRNRPVPGTKVCRYHGGAAPQVRAAGQRRLAAAKIEADAAAAVAQMGLMTVEDPLGELSKLAAGSRAMLESLGARVNALSDIETWDDKQAPHARVALEAYERALDRTHRLLDTLVKHGYAERQIAIAEGEALLVSGIIRRVIAALGLSPEQQKRAQSLLAAEFRALDSKEAK